VATQFVAASSTYLINQTARITTEPFTVGIWVYPTSTATNQRYWSLADTGAANIGWCMDIQTDATWRFWANAVGAISSIAVAGAVTVNKWHFLLARAISSTNRRLAVLQPDGATAHGQNTATESPASADTIGLGAFVDSAAGQYLDGSLAEFWYTDTDIQPDGEQLQDALLRQLAYGGPFSVPHIVKNIVEYRSLRLTPSSRGDNGGDVYYGKFGVQTWGNVNAANMGPHPPLPYWYVKPGQVIRNMMG
jgi:hypothetical protein